MNGKVDNLISRQAAIEKVRKISGLIVSMTTEGHETILVDKAQVQTELMMLPSAERDYKFDEWCTDCKEYDHERHCCPRFNHVIRTTLQEVQEERKKRKWIEFDSDDKYDVIKCPCCKHIFTVDSYHWTDIGFIKDDFKFCPNCGADMRGEQDG